MSLSQEKLFDQSVYLLKQLICIPSFSREEKRTADLMEAFLKHASLKVNRKYNNVWAYAAYPNPNKPTIMLNSHHDTVKPVAGWKSDPFEAKLEGDKLTGLGSNDAGAALVSLLATFLYLREQGELPYNLLYLASAEEEISGSKGVAAVLEDIGTIDLGIVGEPTEMHMAIAEKGLMVLDCYAEGKSGHAARNEGINAIYQALRDISWFRDYAFEQESELLGKVKMSVTQIDAGTQHNVVPDRCHYVVDVRSNEKYSNRELFTIIDAAVASKVEPRSFRLNSSGIPKAHPVVQRGIALERNCFGSPTLSDQALIPYPTLKIGPGDSARSHTAEEYIYLSEMKAGQELYIQLLEGLELR